jgi:hypothetical protein
MTMKDTFYIVDGENNTVWIGKEKGDKPQVFHNFAKADKRAREVADSEPGIEVKIVKVVGIVLSAVLPPKTRRVA